MMLADKVDAIGPRGKRIGRLVLYAILAVDLPACAIQTWLKFRFDAASRTPVPEMGQVHAVYVVGKGFHFTAYTTRTLSTLWSLSNLAMFGCTGLLVVSGIGVLCWRHLRRRLSG